MLADAHESASEYLKAFVKVGAVALKEADSEKGAAEFRRGQELLRSMVVVACAGLESALKEVLRKTLDPLASSDMMVAAKFEAWVARTMKDPENSDFMAHVFSALEPPRHVLIRGYVSEKVSDSLQSTRGLEETIAALGLGKGTLDWNSFANVHRAFECRNQIIHEYDFIEIGGRITRRMRTVEEIVNYVNALFDAGDRILTAAVDRVDSTSEASEPAVTASRSRSITYSSMAPAGSGAEGHASFPSLSRFVQR